MHALNTSPSDWIVRWTPLLAPGAQVLDLACGSGRHSRWLQAQGLAVTAVDRDVQALHQVTACGATVVQADLEAEGPYPLAGRQFDGVVVTHYLWRPRWPALLDLVAPGGVLLYETFAAGHERLGRPSRPDFLLQPGELLRVCTGWQVIAFEEGLLQGPDRIVQRIAARRPGPLTAFTPPLRPSPAAAG
ncbi:class I SAM-dependent methyltransferase [Ideonella livida]|uniref:Class I SAM-dependent methyltransferase n=1 Tax=Ideonella livida TaxID=2707176 RepID=A0A7C9TGS8_9BURK|nr:class I SAM-dependent methyltransferase [Ideonella livida]NDY89900.1 class I SAM-dependent methyltransferase [Ideonella livida]